MLDTSTIAAQGSAFRTLSKERHLDTDPMTAWSDWSSAEGIARWWGPEGSHIELRIGGRFEIYFSLAEPEGARGSEGCRYLAYVPGEMISFTWNAPPHLPLRTTNTWVVITVAPVTEGRTKIRLVHAGFLDGPDWNDYLAYFDRAWDHVLDLHQSHYAAQ